MTVQVTEAAPRLVDSMIPLLFRVVSAKRETIDTVTTVFETVDGSDVFPYKVGQFNMVYIFGVGEIPISISGDPGDRRRLIHTTRDVGLVSKAVCELKPGDVVGVRGPYGSCWPIEKAYGKDLVLVAGGLGMAPLRSTVYTALANRDKFKRLLLMHSAHRPENLLYWEELEHWRARFDFEVDIIVGHADHTWHGNIGYVTKFIPNALFDPENSMVFICGPEVLMRFSALDFEKRGVSGDRIYLASERNMKCGIGLCGHCQFGPHFMCKDGAIFSFDTIRDLMTKEEI